MNYIKKIGFSLIYTLCSILILTLIVTIFNYFEIFSEKTISIFKIIIPIISFIIGGFYVGKRSSKSGYIEGLKFGIISSVLIVIFNFLALDNSFKLKYTLFYLILIISSILGSMIGINKRKNC